MKQKLKFFSVLALLMVLMQISVFHVHVTAKTQSVSQKSTALKVYERFLSKKKIDFGSYSAPMKNCEFGLAYINNDKIPELIIRYYTEIRIFTCKNGKVKTVLKDGGVYEGPPDIFCYKKSGRYVITGEEYNGSWKAYYLWTGGENIKKLEFSYSIFDGPQCYFYQEGNMQQCPKLYFNKLVKEFSGSRKRSKIALHKVTKKNISKYLK